MNKYLSALIVFVSISLFYMPQVFGDTLVLLNNGTISGTVVQTNGDEVLLLMDYAAFNFSRANIKAVKITREESVEQSATDRLPNFKHLVLFLSQQPWATNLSPIPATVIDKGILRNVPYSSFRCGEDYEVNIYGDLDSPAGIEIGVYRRLLEDGSAKTNCLKFISNLLGQSADKEIVQKLNLKKDLKIGGELTFEITPPTDEDAYNGWWISVYSEKKLNLARASGEELKQISTVKTDIVKNADQSENLSSWSADELKHARPSSPALITFTAKSGVVVSNAEVVHINDGVSLVWRKDNGASGGTVRLADLPENLRAEFGYDPAKTAATDALEAQDKAQTQADAAQAAQVLQESQTTAARNAGGDFQSYGISDYSGDSSGGGSVYVHGYYRSNGTYVNAYTRSYPRSR